MELIMSDIHISSMNVRGFGFHYSVPSTDDVIMDMMCKLYAKKAHQHYMDELRKDVSAFSAIDLNETLQSMLGNSVR